MTSAPRGIRVRLQLDAEPLELPAGLTADLGVVLADAAREDEEVEPPQRRREGADGLANAVREHRHGQRGPRPRRGPLGERPHVRGAAHGQQAGLTLADPREVVGRQAVLARQEDERARIEIARARAHHDSSRRREAHRRVDGATVLHGDEARSVAEVSDDHAARAATGPRTDMMYSYERPSKPVAAHLIAQEGVRQRQQPPRVLGHRRVKGRVEAGDLVDPGPARGRGAHALDRGRQGAAARAARAAFELLGEQRGVDARGRRVPSAAVHDPMPDARGRRASRNLFGRREGQRERAREVTRRARRRADPRPCAPTRDRSCGRCPRRRRLRAALHRPVAPRRGRT